jgi:hypothetical protein
LYCTHHRLLTHISQQYVPLFLAKEDLDVAVQAAYVARNGTQIAGYREKAARYEEEAVTVETQAEAAAAGREKANLEGRATKARAKANTAREKADAVARAPLPRVEVGCFEEVLQRMSDSSGDDLAAWSQVMFVAPGLLQNQSSPALSGSTPLSLMPSSPVSGSSVAATVPGTREDLSGKALTAAGSKAPGGK